jgi:hypothetical protein
MSRDNPTASPRPADTRATSTRTDATEGRSGSSPVSTRPAARLRRSYFAIARGRRGYRTTALQHSKGRAFPRMGRQAARESLNASRHPAHANRGRAKPTRDSRVRWRDGCLGTRWSERKAQPWEGFRMRSRAFVSPALPGLALGLPPAGTARAEQFANDHVDREALALHAHQVFRSVLEAQQSKAEARVDAEISAGAPGAIRTTPEQAVSPERTERSDWSHGGHCYGWGSRPTRLPRWRRRPRGNPAASRLACAVRRDAGVAGLERLPGRDRAAGTRTPCAPNGRACVTLPRRPTPISGATPVLGR